MCICVRVHEMRVHVRAELRSWKLNGLCALACGLARTCLHFGWNAFYISHTQGQAWELEQCLK